MWNNGSHERDFGSFVATRRKEAKKEEAKLLRLLHIFGYKLKPYREIWRFFIKKFEEIWLLENSLKSHCLAIFENRLIPKKKKKKKKKTLVC
jgi:hypothetical protein